MIEVKHLRLLDALARHGSMSAAARELGYSQSAVTQQIQHLERQLRTPVVARARSGVKLTDAGEVLVRHGRPVLSALTLAAAEVDAVAGLRTGRIRVVSFPSAAATIVPRALGRVAKQHPGLAFSLVEAEPPTALAVLRRGDCDLALVYAYVGAGEAATDKLGLQSGEVAVPLIEENVQVAMPRNHRAAGNRWVDLATLAREPWIAGCPECRGHLLDACARSGFEPEIAFETDDYVALQGLAAEGLGVALVTDLALIAARPRARLALRRVSPVSVRAVCAVTTESLLRVPGVEQTMAAVGASAARLTPPDLS